MSQNSLVAQGDELKQFILGVRNLVGFLLAVVVLAYPMGLVYESVAVYLPATVNITAEWASPLKEVANGLYLLCSLALYVLMGFLLLSLCYGIIMTMGKLSMHTEKAE